PVRGRWGADRVAPEPAQQVPVLGEPHDRVGEGGVRGGVVQPVRAVRGEQAVLPVGDVLADAGAAAGDDGQPRGARLQAGDPEGLEPRGGDEDVLPGVAGAQLVPLQLADEADDAVQPEPVDVPAYPRLLRAGADDGEVEPRRPG